MVTYWAILNEKNIVLQVITGVENKIIDGLSASDYYSNFVGAKCVQTFTNKKNVRQAGIGYTYDKDRDAFIAPKPFESWTLDECLEWVAPKPYPVGDGVYYWNEKIKEWVKNV